MSEHDESAHAWHNSAIEDVLTRLAAPRSGLSTAEAQQRLVRFGENRLPPPYRRGPLLRFLLQFHNVLIYVLLASAGLTALVADWTDTLVIVGVVLINALIGFVQEGKAEKAVMAIQRMLPLRAVVQRDGQRREIPAEQLVPGDVVFVQTGDKVPADLRLFDTKNLRIEEAALTGESEAVEKSPHAVSVESPLGDRFCMSYSGTLVVYGQGTGVVVTTGAATELGRISALLATVQELSTPLMRRMVSFGRWLALVIVGVAVATFVVGFGLRNYPVEELLMAVVGLAVAAIPEGLPAIMTITLAIGVQRMARRNAIIRRLPAVETLGSVTVVCTDKTGTLTKNEMTVNHVITAAASYSVTGAGYAPHGGFTVVGRDVRADTDLELIEIARAALLCNDGALRLHDGQWELTGDPTDGALLTLGMKAGLERGFLQEALPRTDAIPFESEHRFMATLHHDHVGNGFIYLKGAPERVLEMCSAQRSGAVDQPLDRGCWQQHIGSLAAGGQRVLALAMKHVAPTQRELSFADTADGFALLGLCGIIDPPREEAIRAVAQCRAAGVSVKMITGDHAATASAIGVQLGIGDGATALTGAQLEKMDDTELRRAVQVTDVFARASPEHKLRLVQALQANGEIIAMTGDGVNDAPALKRADVGVAMGVKGTEAAKEAAEMVLADDNFASVAIAIEEGRTVYDNLRKSMLFMLPTNGGQASVIIAAILFGVTLPITPIQILWVNLITAVTLALALAFEPSEPGVMQRPPRDPLEPLLSGFLVWRVAFVSTLLLAGSLGLFLWETGRGVSVEAGRTIAVNALIFGQVFYLFSSRHIYGSAFNRASLFGNRFVLLAVAAILALQLLFTYLPWLQRGFDTAALDLAAWWRIVLFGLVVFLLVEAEKRLIRSIWKLQ